jgi:hypothetical protein
MDYMGGRLELISTGFEDRHFLTLASLAQKSLIMDAAILEIIAAITLSREANSHPQSFNRGK